MNNAGAQTYNTGEEWPASGIQIVAHDPIPAVSGWNMIGGYENSDFYITTTPGISGWTGIWIQWCIYNAANIEPGYGYWIKLTGAGDIIIPEALAKDSKPVEWFPEDWGRIVLRDAAGKRYTLYAVKGEVDLNQYELPPLPPTGMFDIRYNSGRIAEDINSSMQTIDMSGVIYPITVRVEGIDIRLMDVTGK